MKVLQVSTWASGVLVICIDDAFVTVVARWVTMYRYGNDVQGVV